MLKLVVGALVALALPSAAQALPDLPRPPVTPADLYVGCYLLVRGTDVPKGDDGYLTNFSALTCGAVAMSAVAHSEGAKPGEDYRFCLPSTAEIRANPLLAMAYAYLDFYDAHSHQMTSRDGVAAFTVAMSMKWPCPVPR